MKSVADEVDNFSTGGDVTIPGAHRLDRGVTSNQITTMGR